MNICPVCGKKHNLRVGNLLWCPTKRQWFNVKNDETVS